MIVRIFAAIVFAGMTSSPAIAQDGAYQGEIRERLSKPVIATFETPKPPYDLEVCLADVMTVLGTPTMLRDGPDTLQMMISQPGTGAYFGSVTLSKLASGTRLELRVRGKGWDDRLRSRIQQCL